MRTRARRAGGYGAAFAAVILSVALVTSTTDAASARTGTRSAGPDNAVQVPAEEGESIALPDGSTAVVDTRSGVARVTAPDGMVTYRRVPATGQVADPATGALLPDKAGLAALLARPPREPFASDQVIVVFADPVAPRSDAFTASPSALSRAADGGSAPPFTPSSTLNSVMAGVGVDAQARLFSSVSRAALRALTSDAAKTSGRPGLSLANAYVLHLTSGDPVAAAGALLRQPGVELATLDWTVQPAGSQSVPLAPGALPAEVDDAATDPVTGSTAKAPSGIDSWTSNFGIRTSAQSFWNGPGLDAAAPFDVIVDTFDRLPGAGQIITEIGLGDLTDNNPGSRCFDSGFGPTTVVRGGQRYIDLPSMPLIPTYTANSSSRLDGLGEVCGPDPLLRSIGHDLSVMAPLPKDLQRPENPGNGLTDLLGLAPGAKYRVVVPASDTPSVSDVSSALLAAAMQAPHPDIITTGITASGDGQGFPQRFLEQDPLAQAVITTIVNALDISVCVGAGDGVRRNSSIAAVGASGGSTPTDAVPGDEAQTTLDDIALSSARSLLHDSGSIAVGATTQNDVFASPPHYSTDPAGRGQAAFAATRWTGATDFASGFGTRIDLSAPADSILSMSHLAGGGAPDAQPNLAEGTGISAAEVAASVAVVRQVADLTGRSFDGPLDVRRYLQQTATPVSDLPQADRHLELGGQVDLNRAVGRLLAAAGQQPSPDVGRFAVAQRRPLANLGALFETSTNPAAINLNGPHSIFDGKLTGANKRAWITLAPDWENIPEDATYALTVGTPCRVVATTPAARVLPAQLLAAAGLPTHSPDRQTVELDYEATWSGGGVGIHSSITFGPSPRTSSSVLAPRVAPVSDGDEVVVRYDLRRARDLQVPVHLVVSYPGRVNPATGAMYDPLRTIELPFTPDDPATRVGTVHVPMSDLEGAGIYGIGIHLADHEVEGFVTPVYSDFAYTRVAADRTSEQPSTPLVSQPTDRSGHSLQVSYGGRVRVTWDVENVPNVDGAALEVSAPGPASAVGVNTFNNPEGNLRDANGVDTGSVTLLTLPSTSGSMVLSAARLGMLPTMTHALRVLAMDGDAVVGEASPMSTVKRDGVRPAGNGPLNESGFAVGTASETGYLATKEFTRRLDLNSSIQGFNTATKTRGSLLAQTQQAHTSYKMNGNGLFGLSTGLVGTYADDSVGEALEFHGIADGQLQPWTPPKQSVLQVRAGGADPTSPTGVFVALDTADGGPAAFRAFTSDVAANTFGRRFDISGGLSGTNPSRVNQVVLDAARDTAVAGFASNDFCAPPILERVDTAAGTAEIIPGLGNGDPFSMALDRTAGVAAVATTCSPELGLYDLDDGSSSLVNLGQNGYYVAADDVHGLILVAKAVPPDFSDNHVVQSSIAVYTTSGTYVKELYGVSLWDVGLVPGLDDLQVDPSTRTAWTFGPLARQLAPILY